MLHNMETHTPAVCCTLETIDTNTGYPQMISRILFGISDIIIHGSKWCENVVVCRRRCWGQPQMIISHKCPSRLRSWGGKCNKILLKNNIYSAPVQRRPPCGDNNTQIKTTNCSLSVHRGLCNYVIQAAPGPGQLLFDAGLLSSCW